MSLGQCQCACRLSDDRSRLRNGYRSRANRSPSLGDGDSRLSNGNGALRDRDRSLSDSCGRLRDRDRALGDSTGRLSDSCSRLRHSDWTFSDRDSRFRNGNGVGWWRRRRTWAEVMVAVVVESTRNGAAEITALAGIALGSER